MNEKKISKVFNSIGLEIIFIPIEINLPRLFSVKYDIAEARIDSVNVKKSLRLLMINEKRKGPIDSFIKQSIVLKQKLQLNFCLVFTEISNETRNQLLKARIPFLDYRGNLFLPELGMLLKENLDVVERKSQKFSPSEQAILISILLFSKGPLIDLKEIEERNHVSVPTIYRTLNKFVENKWVNSDFNQYRLNMSRVNIFEEAKENIINPISSVYYINRGNSNMSIKNELEDFLRYRILDSGMSALKSYTNIESDIDSFVISKKSFKNYLNLKPELTHYFDKNKIFDAAEVQLWKYEPIPVQNRNAVDPISLFYSITDTDDPRISIALDELYKTIILIMENNDAY